ncbi:MAG: hypothetical protein R2697_18770 [Ilumatobacteraceae bacterium]
MLEQLGVDLHRPSVAFVGRITRQKGVPHLLRAALQLDESAQLVLLAGAADTPELKAETDAAIADLRGVARRSSRRVGDAAATRCGRCSPTARCSCAPRSTSRSAS